MKKLAVVTLALLAAACNVDTSPAPASDPGAGAGDPGAAAPIMPARSVSKDPMAPSPTPSPGMAIVRVIHASPDAPKVDVYAKGSAMPLVTGLGYGETSGWLEVPPGAYELELRAAGALATDPIAYKTTAITITASEKLSAVAAGLLGAQDADSAFRVLPVVEGFGPMVLGSARLRVLHGGADAPSVDLDVGNDDPTKPEVAGLARFVDTGAAGVALPANQALAIGIAAGGARVTSFTTPKLPQGADVLVIATGLLGKLARERDGFALLAIGPNGSIGFVKQDPRLVALHASPDAPRVDAFVGNREIVADLGFGELASSVQVQPGSYSVDLFAHQDGAMRPAGEPALAAPSGALEAGERYLAVAAGLLSGNGGAALRIATYREGFALDGSLQLRAVHASPDAPSVDIGLTTGTKIDPVLFGGLSFSQSSADTGLTATPGHLPLGVTPAGQNASLVARIGVPTTSGQRAFVVAAGAISPHLGQGFRFLVVDTAASPWTVTTALPH